jgi:hypothetical protein
VRTYKPKINHFYKKNLTVVKQLLSATLPYRPVSQAMARFGIAEESMEGFRWWWFKLIYEKSLPSNNNMWKLIEIAIKTKKDTKCPRYL